MRAKEVVVSYKEGSERNSAVRAVKAAGRSDMKFKSSIKAFNELFERSEFFRLFIEVLKTDYLMVCNIRIVV